jgi:hypothetical protein
MSAEDVNAASDAASREWRRSTRTYGGSNCVEVAVLSGERIDVRDSKNPRGAVLRFSSADWNAFVSGIRGGYPVLPAS